MTIENNMANGIYLFTEKTISISSISSIITTNKNKIATAPMYTIANIMPTNSAPIKINKNVELRKARIKNKTELTGFFEKITDRLLKMRKIAKK